MNNGSVLVVEYTYVSQKAQFGLVMSQRVQSIREEQYARVLVCPIGYCYELPFVINCSYHNFFCYELSLNAHTTIAEKSAREKTKRAQSTRKTRLPLIRPGYRQLPAIKNTVKNGHIFFVEKTAAEP